MNAAESLGLGSIWIHRAKEEFESDFGKRFLQILALKAIMKELDIAQSDMQPHLPMRRHREKKTMFIM